MTVTATLCMRSATGTLTFGLIGEWQWAHCYDCYSEGQGLIPSTRWPSLQELLMIFSSWLTGHSRLHSQARWHHRTSWGCCRGGYMNPRGLFLSTTMKNIQNIHAQAWLHPFWTPDGREQNGWPKESHGNVKGVRGGPVLCMITELLSHGNWTLMSLSKI